MFFRIKVPIESSSSYERQLEDFPLSEMWRIQTDGWQHDLGPQNFRDIYYRGMEKGFEFLKNNWQNSLSVEMIEKFYHSAFQFEKEYQDKVCQTGIRDKISGNFEIFYNMPGVSNEAAISEEGLLEFVDNFIEAQGDRTPDQFYRWGITIFKQGTLQSVNPKEFKTREDLAGFLRTNLINAALTKDQSEGHKEFSGPATKVEIHCTARYDRPFLISFINKEIAKYQCEIADLKKNHADSRENIISAIVKLIRKLHQTHCFPDGNGRTFIFLLTNMLLLQNGLPMAIMITPNHFAGFSVRELTQEVMRGQELLQSFMIKNVKNYLQSLSATEIIQDKDKIKTNIEKNLSNNPLIALAQLNDVFLKIQKNVIKTPINYWGDTYDYKLFNLFSSTFSNDNIAHKNILEILKELYVSITNNYLLKKNQHERELFQVIISRHMLTNELVLSARLVL